MDHGKAILGDTPMGNLSPDDLEVFRRPTTDLVTAGRLLGVGRATADKAARLGHIPTIRIAGRRRVPTEWLLHALRRGIPQAAA
ncbi:hypothetical protein ACU4GR_33885 (plasmid) [Methylobacterium oryzae CBMB20]